MADAPRLKELVTAAYGHWVERLGSTPRPVLDDYDQVVREHDVTVAERAGAIVGLLVLEHGADGLYVDNVAVDPAHQGTGAGRALLEHAEAVARSAGRSEIRLYTHEHMTENRALYERIGYEEYERRPLRDGSASLVYMRKRL